MAFSSDCIVTFPLCCCCRVGGAPVTSQLSPKPVKLQPAKQVMGPDKPAYRAFVSSNIYTQAYRICAGLFPRLGLLNDHLITSGIPVFHQPLQSSDFFSCDGLRAITLEQVGKQSFYSYNWFLQAPVSHMQECMQSWAPFHQFNHLFCEVCFCVLSRVCCWNATIYLLGR